ncbi:MAG TPA: fumarylacetoacetate hydrolase family protein [Candidatus Binataceae bacterium]|jgi:2-keto-4-pentenoate hydratase/2-oxohepta-3-ene-1,7-dioic acid hydratase in catechol pathway
MKLVRYSTNSGARIGAVKGDRIVDLSGPVPALDDNMIELIMRWPDLRGPLQQVVQDSAPGIALAEARLLAPVARPGKVMAIGLNYADHIRETGQKLPTHQIWFTKAVTSINGPFDPIELPIASAQVDYEAELVVVIGKRCKQVPKEHAAEVVFGYCAGNDVSVRDWQLQTTQWVLGKSFDTHAPIGPWIVTADELGDPHTMGIRCLVNGELRQNSNTGNLVFNVYDQIAHLSRAMTLEPGDVVFTGTPGGVGLAMSPPRWLKAGDKVRVEIDRIGAIEALMRPEGAAL